MLPLMISVYRRSNFSGGRHKTFLFLKGGISAIQGHPRSMNLYQSKAHTVCDFLVRNSNLGPVLHRFGAMARFMCSCPQPAIPR